MVDKKRNKIGHSSRSSSIQRIKTNADQRWTKDKQTDKKKRIRKEKNVKRRKEEKIKRKNT